MRRKERLIQDQEIIDQIIAKSVICRVALHDEKYPYMVPMNYGYRNNSLYFHCALEGKKLNLIRKNNKVCFEIELDHEIVKYAESCKWTTKYRSVVGYGTMEIIEDHDEKQKGLDIIMQHHGKMENEYVDKIVKRIHILKLNIDRSTGKQGGDWE